MMYEQLELKIIGSYKYIKFESFREKKQVNLCIKIQKQPIQSVN